MANNKDSSDSKTKKSSFCGHIMNLARVMIFAHLRKTVFCVLLFPKSRSVNSPCAMHRGL